MQLLILVIIAGVVGYYLSRSRFSKPIDDAADKVADVSRGAADSVEGWGRNLFRRKSNSAEQVIEGKAVDAATGTPAAESPTSATPIAEKQPSRRRVSETDTGTRTE